MGGLAHEARRCAVPLRAIDEEESMTTYGGDDATAAGVAFQGAPGIVGLVEEFPWLTN